MAYETSTVQDIVPGLSAVVGVVLPQSGKVIITIYHWVEIDSINVRVILKQVELQYIRDYFGVTGGFGLKEDTVRGINFSPILSFSGVIGNSFLKLGSSMAFDMSQHKLDAFNVGLSCNAAFITTSLTMWAFSSLVKAITKIVIQGFNFWGLNAMNI